MGHLLLTLIHGMQIGTQIAAILVILIVNQAHYLLAFYTSRFERQAFIRIILSPC